MQYHGGRFSAIDDMYALAPRHVSYGSFAAELIGADAPVCLLCPNSVQEYCCAAHDALYQKRHFTLGLN
jgi:hypothetical protein